MEKIKLEKEISLGEAISIAINKINEIIDWINKKEPDSPKIITKEEIMEEFRTIRTIFTSKMLDNPDEYGLYKTSIFYKNLDSWLSNILDKLNVK